MKRVTAILLAAGESRRMGSCNKLALTVNGVPLLRRIATTLLDSRMQELAHGSAHATQPQSILLQDALEMRK